MSGRRLVLVDLSSIAHPIWHMSGSDADPNAASQKIVARVRSLASDQPHVAICCDSGRSFRNEIDPAYKANRPATLAPFRHQVALAIEMLEADGFPIWKADGFEADDLIASATAAVLKTDDVSTVAIISADKDLLQLVCPRVVAVSTRDWSTFDEDAVAVKFGVKPTQMRDLLTLMGDSSDNVKGANGIGEKKAAELLQRFHSIDDLYRDLKEVGPTQLRITPGLLTSLREFEPRVEHVRKLITLRTDAPVDLEQAFAPRQQQASSDVAIDFEESAMEQEAAPAPVAFPETPSAQALAVARVPDIMPVEYERQLEPRTLGQTHELAKAIFASRLFSAYGNPEAVLSTLLAGRELGLQSMASLRAIHIIDGKPTLSADLIRALILRSGKAEYFRCTERSAERATFVSKRIGQPEQSLTVTIEEARKAWPKDQAGWDKSGWGKNPADMLVARSGAKLARLDYPDVVHGIYTREEIEESREVAA